MAATGEPVDSDAAISGLWQGFASSRDPALRNRLIRLYQPYAKKLAVRTYILRRDNSVSFNDYLQYAHVGLMESIDRFEPERPVRFETFAAYRIRGAILNGLTKESELAAQRRYWAERMRERLESLKQEPAADSDVDHMLEGFVDLTVGLALGLLLEPPGEPVDESPTANPYVAAELGQLAVRVRKAVARLPERERAIIESHYFRHEPFQDIAVQFEVTKGRISQMHAQALKRLRAELENERVAVDREI